LIARSLITEVAVPLETPQHIQDDIAKLGEELLARGYAENPKEDSAAARYTAQMMARRMFDPEQNTLPLTVEVLKPALTIEDAEPRSVNFVAVRRADKPAEYLALAIGSNPEDEDKEKDWQIVHAVPLEQFRAALVAGGPLWESIFAVAPEAGPRDTIGRLSLPRPVPKSKPKSAELTPVA
jgi:hypothetical protein